MIKPTSTRRSFLRGAISFAAAALAMPTALTDASTQRVTFAKHSVFLGIDPASPGYDSTGAVFVATPSGVYHLLERLGHTRNPHAEAARWRQLRVYSPSALDQLARRLHRRLA